MKNHQLSKKHKENLEALKATMTTEDLKLLSQPVGLESLSKLISLV